MLLPVFRPLICLLVSPPSIRLPIHSLVHTSVSRSVRRWVRPSFLHRYVGPSICLFFSLSFRPTAFTSLLK